MIQVTTTEGEGFEAETAEEVVRAMFKSSRIPRRNKPLEAFMQATARRCAMWDLAQIDTTSAITFLHTLASSGYILLDGVGE